MIFRIQNTRRSVLNCLVIVLWKYESRLIFAVFSMHLSCLKYISCQALFWYSLLIFILIKKCHINPLPHLSKHFFNTRLLSLFHMHGQLLQCMTSSECPTSNLHETVREFQLLQIPASIKNIPSNLPQTVRENNFLNFISCQNTLFPAKSKTIFHLPDTGILKLFRLIHMTGERIRRSTDHHFLIYHLRNLNPALNSQTSQNLNSTRFLSVIYLHFSLPGNLFSKIFHFTIYNKDFHFE